MSPLPEVLPAFPELVMVHECLHRYRSASLRRRLAWWSSCPSSSSGPSCCGSATKSSRRVHAARICWRLPLPLGSLCRPCCACRGCQFIVASEAQPPQREERAESFITTWGSLTGLLCLSLESQDWLVSAHGRMTRFEYLTLWLTFAFIMVRAFSSASSASFSAGVISSVLLQHVIMHPRAPKIGDSKPSSFSRPQAFGLELGIAAGLVLAALFFSVQYAKCAPRFQRAPEAWKTQRKPQCHASACAFVWHTFP